jgi:3-oxoadipate enol-lactonase
VDGTLKRWFTEGFHQRKPGDIAKVREMILGTGVEGYMACAGAVRDMAQTTMLLEVKAPTLVTTGRQDPACTVAQSTVLHRMIDGSRLEIIEDAAHLSNIEQPEAFNRLLRGFLDEVDDRLGAGA